MDKETRKTQERIAYVLSGVEKPRAKKDARGTGVARKTGFKPSGDQSPRPNLVVVRGGRE